MSSNQAWVCTSPTSSAVTSARQAGQTGVRGCSRADTLDGRARCLSCSRSNPPPSKKKNKNKLILEWEVSQLDAHMDRRVQGEWSETKWIKEVGESTNSGRMVTKSSDLRSGRFRSCLLMICFGLRCDAFMLFFWGWGVKIFQSWSLRIGTGCEKTGFYYLIMQHLIPKINQSLVSTGVCLIFKPPICQFTAPKGVALWSNVSHYNIKQALSKPRGRTTEGN